MTLLKQTTRPSQLITNKLPENSNWVEISASALAHNLDQYTAISPATLCAPVIKSNAYGHCIDLVAQLLDKNNAVGMLCVATLSEAVSLRSLGIKKPLLVLSIIDRNLEQAVIHDIAIVAYDTTTLATLHQYAQKHQKTGIVHIKIDTGLSRLGLLSDKALQFIQYATTLPYITVQGIFTHYAYSENKNQEYTQYQLAQFNSINDCLSQKGITIPLRHTSCSAAVTANSATHHTMVRVGIGLYGLWPSTDNKEITLQKHPHFSLQPVLTWKTRIIQIKEIPANTSVGYNLTYKTRSATKIATLPVGYWDGYDRRLSNKGIVLINGTYAPVVGIVAMNLMMIDVTAVSAAVGDEVILLGNYEEITADALAKKCNTINYEIVTRINPLAPRIATL